MWGISLIRIKSLQDGKLATVIFYFAITSFILVRRADFFKNSTTDLLINVLVIIAVLATLFAFFMYSLKYYKIIKKE